jgi:hypothetical protein
MSQEKTLVIDPNTRIGQCAEHLLGTAKGFGYQRLGLNYQQVVQAFTFALGLLNQEQHELIAEKERDCRRAA